MSVSGGRDRVEQDILSELADRPAAPPAVVRAVGSRDPGLTAGEVRQVIWSMIGRGVIDFTAEGTLRLSERR